MGGLAGMAQEWSGDLSRAIADYRRSCEFSRNAPYPLSCLAHALAVVGDPPPGPDIARVYVGLGDFWQALQWLEKSAAQRSLYLLKAVGDPRFDRLLSEPRYRSIIGDM
jgi:hypothetical protein